MFALTMITLLCIIGLCIADMIAIVRNNKQFKCLMFKVTIYTSFFIITEWTIVMGKEQEMFWFFILITGLIVAVICEMYQIRILQNKIWNLENTQDEHSKLIDCLNDEIEVLERLNKRVN